MAIKTSIHEGEKDEMWQTGLFQCEIYITGVNKLKVKNYKKKKKKILMQFNLTILSKQVKKNNQNDDEMSY